MYYHFVTGAGGVKRVLAASDLAAGMKLDTMYTSPVTKRPAQLTVVAAASGGGGAAGTGADAGAAPRVQIKSVGTTASVVLPDVRCGAGVAHMIDSPLVPVPMSFVAAALRGR